MHVVFKRTEYGPIIRGYCENDKVNKILKLLNDNEAEENPESSYEGLRQQHQNLLTKKERLKAQKLSAKSLNVRVEPEVFKFLKDAERLSNMEVDRQISQVDKNIVDVLGKLQLEKPFYAKPARLLTVDDVLIEIQGGEDNNEY
jgi:hypothetical protein